MKYISFIIIALWAYWMIYENGDLTPKQNYFLFYLGLVSVYYTAIYLLVFIIKIIKK